MFNQTFKRRVVPAVFALAALPALAPSASAMTPAEEWGTQVQSQVGAWMDQYGMEVSHTVYNTTVSGYGQSVTLPVDLPPVVDAALEALPGVEMTQWSTTYGINETEPETVRVENNDLAPGEERVVQEGDTGWEWNAGDASGVIAPSTPTIVEYRAPEPEVLAVNSTPVPQENLAPAQPYGVWDSLAQCESGGNWSINTGNGYQGGLQFSPSTWIGYGGGQYAPSADQATREQQIDIAQRVQAGQGWGAWPACTSALGIR